MVTMHVAPCVKEGRGKREQLTCHAMERSHSGLVHTPTAGGKGNLSHANFMTLLPLLLFSHRVKQSLGDREEGDDPRGPPVGACEREEGRIALGGLRIGSPAGRLRQVGRLKASGPAAVAAERGGYARLG
jgi:hypothetical protein